MSNSTIFNGRRVIRPLEALKAVRQLMRDKDDTTQVFRILDSLAGSSPYAGFKRFCGLPIGQSILAKPEHLAEILSNRSEMESLPEGSLGRAYLHFMDRCGLTAQGLNAAAADAGVDETGWNADFAKYELRLRCSHDLWHTVSGYGCDGLGEVCLVAFSYRHVRNFGFMLIAIFGAYNYKRQFPDKPIWRTMWEGFKRGGKAEWLVAADWERLLPMPLAVVQRELHMPAAPYYTGIPEVVSATLVASPLTA